MQVTVAKNRTSHILAGITSAKAFTLDNGFSGTSVEELEWLRSYLMKLNPKVSFDKIAGTGIARLHSNAWYEFKVRA